MIRRQFVYSKTRIGVLVQTAHEIPGIFLAVSAGVALLSQMPWLKEMNAVFNVMTNTKSNRLPKAIKLRLICEELVSPSLPTPSSPNVVVKLVDASLFKIKI